jgi:hypothetical protein
MGTWVGTYLVGLMERDPCCGSCRSSFCVLSSWGLRSPADGLGQLYFFLCVGEQEPFSMTLVLESGFFFQGESPER